jgi:hypothetical protein
MRNVRTPAGLKFKYYPTGLPSETVKIPTSEIRRGRRGARVCMLCGRVCWARPFGTPVCLYVTPALYVSIVCMG